MTQTGTASPRMERILQSTRELALRGGVRGITIAEIAHQAGVGKGTLYLYWQTKEDLLADLFAHDFLEALSEVETAVRNDPALIAPHHLLPLVRSTMEQHPFAAAVQTHDREILGVIVAHPAIVQVVRAIGPVAMLRRILPVLRQHGVVRTDLAVETQVHATAALLHGIHEVESREPVAALLPGSDSRAVLSDACAVLLEPLNPVDPCSAAREALTELGGARTLAIAGLREHGLGKTGAP